MRIFYFFIIEKSFQHHVNKITFAFFRKCEDYSHIFAKNYKHNATVHKMDSNKGTTKERVFNNGLTPSKVEGAKALLAQVNVADVCRAVNVKRSVIENVLRDESPRLEDLKKVLIEARKRVRKKERTLKALPV